jgi:hypothetical protein
MPRRGFEPRLDDNQALSQHPWGWAVAAHGTASVRRRAQDRVFAERPALGPRPASISAVTFAELWRRGQVGWPRRFPIAQFPNPPLLLALAGWGLGAVTGGTAHDVGRAVFTFGLAVWALEEAVRGVNWFRRLLGAGVLAWIVAGLAS